MFICKASMQHDPQSLYRLSRTQYRTFSYHKMILQFLCGLVLIYLGFSLSSSLVLKTICLFTGCWFVGSPDEASKHAARKVIKAMGGKYPKTDYEFHTDHFIIIAEGGKRIRIGYDKIIRLVQDRDYYYLYISKLSAYMIEKKSILPEDACFEEFLSRVCHLPWTKPVTLLNFGLRTFRTEKKNTEGPRL